MGRFSKAMNRAVGREDESKLSIAAAGMLILFGLLFAVLCVIVVLTT